MELAQSSAAFCTSSDLSRFPQTSLCKFWVGRKHRWPMSGKAGGACQGSLLLLPLAPPRERLSHVQPHSEEGVGFPGRLVCPCEVQQLSCQCRTARQDGWDRRTLPSAR